MNAILHAYRWLLVGLALLASLSAAQAQGVSAYLDRSSVFEGESVLLTIEATGQVGGDSPDVGQLTGDFHILGSNRTMRIELVDGRNRSKTLWTLELEPKRNGDLQIPALHIGSKLSTPPLKLTVLAQTAANAKPDDEVFIETQAEPLNPYVQAEVRYRERLFYAIPLREGVLGYLEPSADILSKRLGEDVQYVAERNGHRYRVVERNYALFPQKSGDLLLPAIAFRGRTAQNDQNPDDRQRLVTRGQRIQTSSQPITLKVRPRPKQFSGSHWLPSAALTLAEAWAPASPQFRVGEPVTRILTLTAKGLDAGQLPPFNLAATGQAHLYPDQPTSETTQDGQWLIGHHEQRVAIVPTAPGELVLPEVKLAWWDTEHDQEQIAILPARTVTVAAASGIQPAAPGTASTAQSSGEQAAAVVPPDALAAAPSSSADAGIWRWLSLGLLLLWLLTLFAWRRDLRARPPARSVVRKAAIPAQAALIQAVQNACRTNDGPRAAKALLDWAAAAWPQHPPTSLGALAARIDEGRDEVLALDRALYAQSSTRWQGAALGNAVRKGLVASAPKTSVREPSLAPLYPSRV
ncbi:MAG: BatD family protein [Gammaproteobacteria bacterium]